MSGGQRGGSLERVRDRFNLKHGLVLSMGNHPGPLEALGLNSTTIHGPTRKLQP